MADIHSSYTEIPLSCKSAADRIAKELGNEDCFASLSDPGCSKLTELEHTLETETGEKIALVAYRL